MEKLDQWLHFDDHRLVGTPAYKLVVLAAKDRSLESSTQGFRKNVLVRGWGRVAVNATSRPATKANVIHHSDQGCQYTSIAFGKHCEKAGIRPSMGSVGDCYDNAMCESFNATLECELLAFHRFKNQRDASAAIFDFIEGWYNPHRKHSALGYLSPNNFERRMDQAA